MIDKEKLRNELLEKRKTLSQSELESKSQKIYNYLVCQSDFINAKSIFVYCSAGKEIMTDDIIIKALADSKAVYVPYCYAKGLMKPVRIYSLEDLKIGKFDIREPKNTEGEVDKAQIDLCIVPNLAIDKNGFRIGYGGGFYDRFMRGEEFRKISLCLSHNVYEKLPHEEHDVNCDIIITENGVLDTNEV